MANISLPQLVLVLVILMLVFGAGRIPQIGDGLGKAIRNFKRGLSTDDDIDVTPKKVPSDTTTEEVDVNEPH